METIYPLFITMLTLLDKSIDLTNSAIHFCENGKAQEVDDVLSSRERVINIISKLQLSVEEASNSFKAESERVESLELLKLWNTDVLNWRLNIEALDEDLVKKLTDLKDQTQKEIRKTYQTNQKFKGYNMSKVK